MGGLGLGLMLALFAERAPAATSQYSILQGSTSATESHFTVVVRTTENVQFQIRDELETLCPLRSELVTYPGSEWAVHRIHATSLSPQHQYQLRVLGPDGAIIERRGFRSLDPTRPTGRLAVASRLRREHHDANLWNHLAQSPNRPDLMLIVGDIARIQRRWFQLSREPLTGLEAWNEFARSRQTLAVYFWKDLVPTLSVWGNDDSPSSTDDYEVWSEIRKIYDTFHPNNALQGVIEPGPGMARQFRLFDRNFIVLDTRTFRGVSAVSPLLGVDQERWLLRKMQEGPNLIVAGTPLFARQSTGDYQDLEWEEFFEEWIAVLREHAVWKKATLAIVTGNAPYSEVSRLEPELLGHETIEITASNTHSPPWRRRLRPTNPRQTAFTDSSNITLLEFAPETKGLEFSVRAIGSRGQDLFRLNLSTACERHLLGALQ